MNKHLLVTVGDQKSALYGIKFISRLFAYKDNIKVTLYYTYSQSPVIWENNPRQHTYINHTKEYEKKGRLALENAKAELVKEGFSMDRIFTKLDVRKTSTAKDILHEGAQGHYDAVVLGKRGVGWLEEAFEESVTKILLKETFNFPVWLCKLSDSKKSGVLVCIDDSEAALRMADHVGFTLNSENSQDVTLFTVCKNSQDAEPLLEKAKKELLKHNFPEERIKKAFVSDKNVGKAILAQARKGNYAAVAMGRREREPKLIKNMFLGSVSTLVFEELESVSLWICH